MARIRTVKPEFYRHEELQDLEIEYPGQHIMLVFSALWGHCDKNGVFEYKPRQLQLDIVPYIWEATGKHLGSTLEVLVKHRFVHRYVFGEKQYGFIPTFKTHQRINGKEALAPALFPELSEMVELIVGEAPVKQPRSTCEATEITGREGNRKGIGREKEGKRNSAFCNAQLSDFNLFWDAFNLKQGKGGAEKAWMAIKNYNDELKDRIIEAAKREASLRPSIIAQGRTPKWAQGWLNEKRWEDEPVIPTIPSNYASKGVMGALERAAEMRMKAMEKQS